MVTLMLICASKTINLLSLNVPQQLLYKFSAWSSRLKSCVSFRGGSPTRIGVSSRSILILGNYKLAHARTYHRRFQLKYAGLPLTIYAGRPDLVSIFLWRARYRALRSGSLWIVKSDIPLAPKWIVLPRYSTEYFFPALVDFLKSLAPNFSARRRIFSILILHIFFLSYSGNYSRQTLLSCHHQAQTSRIGV